MFQPGDLVRPKGKQFLQLTNADDPYGPSIDVRYDAMPFIFLGDRIDKQVSRFRQGAYVELTESYVKVLVGRTRYWVRESLLELA